ncbi:MAG: nitronate monooxygenase [Saprospiraceae bacterium]
MLSELLGIKYPVILAPMFLVSNTKMVKAAIDAGITGVIPALNYRNSEEFRKALQELKDTGKVYGINLIVNVSNYKLKEQLDLCKEFKVPFIITSLGNPKQVIEQCQPLGMKVFCDVSDMQYAHKSVRYKPDALIAVLDNAGGHCGKISAEQFIPDLVKAFPNIPIISAGGVGNKKGIDKMLSLGACGVSVGSIFIASEEAEVIEEYKNACVHFGAKDIITTTKLSGVPCTVINTPYVQEIGSKENFLERILNKNKTFKKWFKMIVYKRGMDKLMKAAFSATYKNVWCAGTTIEYTTEILPVKEIVSRLVNNENNDER